MNKQPQTKTKDDELELLLAQFNASEPDSVFVKELESQLVEKFNSPNLVFSVFNMRKFFALGLLTLVALSTLFFIPKVANRFAPNQPELIKKIKAATNKFDVAKYNYRKSTATINYGPAFSQCPNVIGAFELNNSFLYANPTRITKIDYEVYQGWVQNKAGKNVSTDYFYKQKGFNDKGVLSDYSLALYGRYSDEHYYWNGSSVSHIGDYNDTSLVPSDFNIDDIQTDESGRGYQFSPEDYQEEIENIELNGRNHYLLRQTITKQCGNEPEVVNYYIDSETYLLSQVVTYYGKIDPVTRITTTNYTHETSSISPEQAKAIFVYDLGKQIEFEDAGKNNISSETKTSNPVSADKSASLKAREQFSWQRPLGDICNYRINRGVSEIHKGVDYVSNVTSCSVVAATSGKVIEAGYHRINGYFVVLDHGQGITSYYFHGAPDSINVRLGEQVNAGAKIMLMGCTGRCTGTHLHFEIHQGEKLLDPQLVLN